MTKYVQPLMHLAKSGVQCIPSEWSIAGGAASWHRIMGGPGVLGRILITGLGYTRQSWAYMDIQTVRQCS